MAQNTLDDFGLLIPVSVDLADGSRGYGFVRDIEGDTITVELEDGQVVRRKPIEVEVL